MKNILLIVAIIMASFGAQATTGVGTVAYYQNGQLQESFEDCNINWILLTDMAVQQNVVDVTCSTAPANDVVMQGTSTLVYVNGKKISCFLNDMLTENNENFVIRFECNPKLFESTFEGK